MAVKSRSGSKVVPGVPAPSQDTNPSKKVEPLKLSSTKVVLEDLLRQKYIQTTIYHIDSHKSYFEVHEYP